MQTDVGFAHIANISTFGGGGDVPPSEQHLLVQVDMMFSHVENGQGGGVGGYQVAVPLGASVHEIYTAVIAAAIPLGASSAFGTSRTFTLTKQDVYVSALA